MLAVKWIFVRENGLENGTTLSNGANQSVLTGRCRSPEMVRKEIGVHALAYNLIRTVMAQAADRNGTIPNIISFKWTL